MGFCRYHRDRPAVGLCMRCKAPVCGECTTRLEGVNHCHVCLKALGGRQEEKRASGESWPVVALTLAGLGVAAMFGIFLFFQGRLAP